MKIEAKMTDGVQLTTGQKERLDRLEHRLVYKQAQNNIRAQYTQPSIFNAPNQYMPMNNPYMAQQSADPMQGMMEMMQQMMPMMMMMKMMGIDSGNMFGGTSEKKSSVTPQEKLGPADADGWQEITQKASTEKTDDADDTSNDAKITNYKNKDGSTKSVTETDDGTTSVITSSDKKRITTEVRDESNNLTSKTIDGKFSVNPKEVNENDPALPNSKFSKADFKYNGEGKVTTIKLTGEDDAKKPTEQVFTRTKETHGGRAVYTSGDDKHKKTYTLIDSQFKEFKKATE